MFILLVFLTLRSGMVEVRHSIAGDLQTCQDAIPYYDKLYRQGKFEDGPRPDKLLDIKIRCEKI